MRFFPAQFYLNQLSLEPPYRPIVFQVQLSQLQVYLIPPERVCLIRAYPLLLSLPRPSRFECAPSRCVRLLNLPPHRKVFYPQPHGQPSPERLSLLVQQHVCQLPLSIVFQSRLFRFLLTLQRFAPFQQLLWPSFPLLLVELLPQQRDRL